MNEKLLQYALSLLGFKRDVCIYSQYYLQNPPHKDLYVWYDSEYDKFFMRDFREEDSIDTMLNVDSIEELQQFLTNLK